MTTQRMLGMIIIIVHNEGRMRYRLECRSWESNYGIKQGEDEESRMCGGEDCKSAKVRCDRN